MKIILWIITLVLLCSFVSAAFPSTTLHYNCNGDYTSTGSLGDGYALANVGTGQTFDTTNKKLGSAACNFTNAGEAGMSNDTGLLTGNQNHTFSYWQYLTVVDVDYHIGVGNGATAPKGSSLQFHATSDIVQGASAVMSTTLPNINTWEYITVVYWANRTAEFYINATFIGAVSVGGAALSLTFDGTYNFCLNSRSGDCTNTVAGIANYDDVRYYEVSLIPIQISLLHNSGMGTESESPTAASPIIINSTYNLTSAIVAGQNSTAWRNGNEAVPIRTSDSTPSMTFSTLGNAYCRINSVNQNWTTMGNTRNCTMTGAKNHVCTLPAADQYTLGTGYKSLYIGCIDESFVNETALSTSGALNLSLGFSPVVSGIQILPSPAYTNSTLNCSFTVKDNDSTVLNVTVNWTGGAFIQNFTSIANNSFLNSTWMPAVVKGTNLTCNVTVTDGESNGIAGANLTISNSDPYNFTISSPINNSQVFGSVLNVSWNCNDSDAFDVLTSSWVLNGTPNGTDVKPNVHVLTGLAYDVCYELFGFCYDNETADSNTLTMNFCTNSTVVCGINVTGIEDDMRYRNNVVTVGLSCNSSVPIDTCSVRINDYAAESINCTIANLTLEMGRNELYFNVSSVAGVNDGLELVIYAKRLNDSGFSGYIVIIVLIVVLGFLMIAYNNFMKIGAVAVLIGLGGIVLGTSIVAFSFWAGGFVIMGSIFFMLYEVLK